MFVAGPPVVNRLSAKQYDKQELGGWEIQLRAGAVDEAVDTEDEAFARARRFLSYLPSSVYDAPPRPRHRRSRAPRGVAVRGDPARHTAKSTRSGRWSRRSSTRGSCLRDGPALRPLGDDRVRAHRRLAGRGAGERSDVLWRRLDGRRLPEGRALRRHGRDLPSADRLLLRLPGLPDRPEAEKSGVIRQGVRTMSAMFQTTVPWCTFIIRNAFGVAGAAHQNGRRSTGAMPGRPAAGVRCRSKAASRRRTAPISTRRPTARPR